MSTKHSIHFWIISTPTYKPKSREIWDKDILCFLFKHLGSLSMDSKREKRNKYNCTWCIHDYFISSEHRVYAFKALCKDVTTQNLPWLWLFSDLWEQSISFFICKSTQSTEHETTMSFMIINSAEIPCWRRGGGVTEALNHTKVHIFCI